MTAGANAELFSLQELIDLQAIVTHHRTQAAKARWLVAVGLFALLNGAGAMLIEWEMLYQVFDYLAGDSGYWSAALMACGALVIVAGFHLLARAHPRHPAVVLVNLVASILIPFYLIGAGLLVASILYADGLGEIAAPQAPIVFGQIAATVDALSGSWIDAVFGQWTRPLAVLVFALGIGGISVINVCVVHETLANAEGNLREAGRRLRRGRAARADWVRIKESQARFAEVSQQLAQLDARWDAAGIREAIAGEVMSTIASALQPHKVWLREQSLKSNSRFRQDEAPAPKVVEEAIALIEAITWDQVTEAMHPQCKEDIL